jgi:adenosyl cobinamide kinase/adenosyl cobinamide phosphate guanylyltransferase
MLTLLLGGARSGKSALAVEMGRRHAGPVVFVATSPPSVDADMDDRIARHRAERPSWPTIEEPLELAAALERGGDALVIVDCLTLWVSNLMSRGDSDDEIEDASIAAIASATRCLAATVVVSNEVGLGVHPETALGLRYRDLLGRVNQQWAHAADTTLFLVGGRAVRLEDPWTFVG